MSYITKGRFEREKKYRISLAIAKNLLNKEIITRIECRKVNIMLRQEEQ